MKREYKILYYLLLLAFSTWSFTQENLPKVHHAEPLYLDLVRDLGARKGEREFNLAAEYINIRKQSKYGLLAEYEWAPINRLGVEVEVDFSFFNASGDTVQYQNKMDCIRLSSQYSLWVLPELQTTFALGYTHIFELTEFAKYGKNNLLEVSVFNPYAIAAKVWFKNWHTLLYGGPLFERDLAKKEWDLNWQINTSILYGLPGDGNFVGVEFNKLIDNAAFSMTIRPQIKLRLNKQTAIGLVAGIPTGRQDKGFSTFVRLIFEPK